MSPTGMNVNFSFALEGLDEHDVWTGSIRPHLSDLRKDPLDIWETCFTEMLNNAVDHSEGTKAWIQVQREDGTTRIWVIDDGIGIFRKIKSAFGLDDERHAILELAKGKLTTDPTKHSGQGIFMTSRLLDRFNILSSGLSFSHRAGVRWDIITDDADPLHGVGTCVVMELKDDTARTMEEVAVMISSVDGDTLAKTLVPVALAKQGNENLVSRSQAKRLLARLDRFETVVLDFEGVDRIGQAFADEIFRVFAKSHPGILLIPINASEEVTRMIVYTAESRVSGKNGDDAANT